MLSVDEALTALLAGARTVAETEWIATAAAARRVLAEDLLAGLDVPPTDNSAVDGYALALADLAHAGAQNGLILGGRHAAGAVPENLMPGAAARIFTGASIPAGADAVAMQEDCRIGEGRLFVTKPLRRGENIRRRGEDLPRGSLAIARGCRLRPQELGVAASLGQARLRVYRRLHVGVVCTGDELIPPGQPLPPGKIYSSNDIILAGLLQGMGCELSRAETSADKLEATATAIDRLARVSDAVITSGGVSVGEEDHVKAALEQCGAMEWWKVAIKPGKPFAFGRVAGTPVLGLPGNPTSLFVTFCVLVRPFLLRMQGAAEVLPPTIPLPAHFQRAAGGRREYLRVRLEAVAGTSGLVLAGPQGSGTLSPAARAHGLAVVPEHRAVQPGDLLDYLSFDQLLN